VLGDKERDRVLEVETESEREIESTVVEREGEEGE
jgi:hypothetical protein